MRTAQGTRSGIKFCPAIHPLVEFKSTLVSDGVYLDCSLCRLERVFSPPCHDWDASVSMLRTERTIPRPYCLCQSRFEAAAVGGSRACSRLPSRFLIGRSGRHHESCTTDVAVDLSANRRTSHVLGRPDSHASVGSEFGDQVDQIDNSPLRVAI
jgi:hypothetical protein